MSQNKNYINNESYFSCFKSLEILKRSLFCSRNVKFIFVGQTGQFIVDTFTIYLHSLKQSGCYI